MTEPTRIEPVSEFLEKMSFQKVKRLLKENVGLDCDGYRDEYLKRRFEVRLRATNCQSYGRYLFYLKKHPEEFQSLLNDLAINFTMFFRDIDVYQYLETILLPKLLALGSQVKIWSAGCASGEEPYSLAIIVHKLLGNKSSNRSVTIFASDIDKDALGKAEKGEYQKKQLNGLPEVSIEKYFSKEGELFRVRDFARKFIRFSQFDLNKPAPYQNLDLILCRNVMIYFSKEGQQHVHMNFYDALREGGYFVTGKAEMLSGEPSRKFQFVDLKCRVYQKSRLLETADQMRIITNSQISCF